MAKDLKAIAVLAGGFSKDEQTGLWRSSHFGEKPTVAEPGSYVRIIAATMLLNRIARNAERSIFVSGGRGQADALFPPGVTCAAIMKHELVELGVPKERIEEETSSNNTAQQLRALDALSKEHGISDLWIITNRFHVQRISAMIHDKRLGLERLPANAKTLDAEEVVVRFNPSFWSAIVESAYASTELAEIIAREKRGTEMVKNGMYQYK